ncbi:MAG: DUF4416 family protein [Planctomycetes bacterium]|jgi:hypothetical protein|nr:DUF4416 family protein [Planctomycetota bacterium]HPY75574.1 DUF4416 family protein [Planctomycetota bacterium]HQB01168.1 DUF4416 family protein [Planctomycetota bacterium]
MGELHNPIPVKLFIGIIYSDANVADKIQTILEEKFGNMDFISPAWPFTYTKYYTPEMGETLWKKFYAFEKLIDPVEIADIKLYTNDIESQYINDNNGRIANLDPGYLTAAKVILATTKDFSHRIYLQKGIYAEITMHYKKGKGFCFSKWTYPDFQSENYTNYFYTLREKFMRQLASLKKNHIQTYLPE